MNLKEIVNKYRDKLLMIFILGVFLFIIMFIISIFGGALMKIFGFEYESVWSIIWYFIVVSLVSWPFDLIVEALPKVLFDFGKVSMNVAIAIYIYSDILLSCMGFRLIDNFMESVAATDIAIVVLAIVFSLIGVKDFKEKLENNSQEG